MCILCIHYLYYYIHMYIYIYIHIHITEIGRPQPFLAFRFASPCVADLVQLTLNEAGAPYTYVSYIHMCHMYAYLCVCVDIYIYIYTHTYMYTNPKP